MEEYDAIIVGASFAGLATARFARGGRVLVLERDPRLGARQRSTCAAPESWVRRLGAGGSILGVMDRLVVHTPGGREIPITMPERYCTLDYAAFCRLVAENLEAEVRTGAEVTRVEAGAGSGFTLHSTGGTFSSRVVVDASGWRAAVASQLMAGYSGAPLARGIETEVEYEVDEVHIYLGNRIAPGGYAWVFPLDNGRARVGLGSLREVNLLELNRRFMRHLGVDSWGSHHGGVIPCSGLRDPVAGGVFVVGDAAGQVLPGTAEGIRKCFVYAELCGRVISRVLSGELPLEEALRTYRRGVLRAKEFYDTMLAIQRIAYRLPDRVLEEVLSRVGSRQLVQRIVGAYFAENRGGVDLTGVASYLRLVGRL
ncbi:MAG: NAD(P)/FAD-dependent oxidoreductase [Euryarchaeota archaeon]|nr:NAD(P)/FAD-dependent oxidoreductase [Euryarchaeota archaeon]